jgi:molecular chaperone GrpE
MQEESTVYTEGIVIEEFQRGFKIGDKLLRPVMVKVSAGPGLASASLDLPLDEALRSD